MGGARGEEELVGGRVGRFNRKFEGMGGSSDGASGLDWNDIGEGEGLEELNEVMNGETPKKPAK